MKIELRSNILNSALFQSLFDLKIPIEISQVHNRFIKLSYTIILAQRAVKFLDLNYLYISKVLAFLNYILSLLNKEKISVQKLYNTANQNSSVINSYNSWI